MHILRTPLALCNVGTGVKYHVHRWLDETPLPGIGPFVLVRRCVVAFVRAGHNAKTESIMRCGFNSRSNQEDDGALPATDALF